jgi:hypothetical protein
MPNSITLSSVPKIVLKKVCLIAPDDPIGWMNAKMPALNGKSIIETLNEPDGLEKVLEVLGKIEGYFGPL